MARKKTPPSEPSKAYLVSFGDTMTALLAFFIVLNSLATEQTGANLHSGTGSFVQVGDSAGVPGMFATGQSALPVQMEEASPIYIVSEDENAEPDAAPNGPDKDGDAYMVKDREQDELQRFMQDMEELHKAKEESGVAGEVAFDRMPPLPREQSPMDALMQEQLLRFAPIMRRRGYELEVRVWATTPAPTAWLRAANQAQELHAGITTFLKLRTDQAKSISVSASPWHSSDVKRPAVSFLLRRVE